MCELGNKIREVKREDTVPVERTRGRFPSSVVSYFRTLYSFTLSSMFFVVSDEMHLPLGVYQSNLT